MSRRGPHFFSTLLMLVVAFGWALLPNSSARAESRCDTWVELADMAGLPETELLPYVGCRHSKSLSIWEEMEVGADDQYVVKVPTSMREDVDSISQELLRLKFAPWLPIDG